jgi:hypothetical protein
MFALVVLLFAGNPLPPLDSRVNSLHFLIEGETAGFNPDGSPILNEGFDKTDWSGEIRFHRDGAMSWEWRSDMQPGLMKFSAIHEGESHSIHILRGKPSQTKLTGDLGFFVEDSKFRDLSDAWPTMFGPYNPLYSNTPASIPTRVEKLNGVDYDVMDVPISNGSRMIRYWITRSNHPNVVQWEEFETNKPPVLIDRCEIRLGKIPLENEPFYFPVESTRSVFKTTNSATKKDSYSKTPQKVFYTRIMPPFMKVNTISDRDSIQFPFMPLSEATTALPQLERRASWFWPLIAGGLASVVSGAIMWRRS